MLKKEMEEEGLGVEIDEKTLGLIRDIFKTLTKTVKTFNVYPNDNPIYRKFAADLFEKFSAFFEANEELPVEVRQHSLWYRENEVFHSEERTDNVALLLFADGIRQISFHRGLVPEEVVDFIEILMRSQRAETRDEDDIVTLFWEKNIKSMSYRAVEDTVDENLLLDEEIVWEGEGPEQEESVGEGKVAESSAKTAVPSFLRGVSLTVSTEELADMKGEASGLGEEFLLSSAAALFHELLSNEDAADVFPEVMLAFGRIIDTLVRKKDLKGITGILRTLRKIAEKYGSGEQTEIIERVFAKAGNLETLRMVFRESEDNEHIREYLALLRKNQIPAMIALLGELEERRQRRLLCEVLAEVGRDDIDALSDAVDDPRWYLVRNLMMILGMTKMPAALGALEKGFSHPETRVRREAVRALESIPSEETKRLYLDAIGDTDVPVRMTALRALRRYRDPELYQKLKGIAALEDLRKRTFAEKKEIIEALAFWGGESAMPLVADLFRKRGLIEKEEITEVRASAAYGLGIIGTPEALSLLVKESASKKDILREACLKALKESPQSGIDRR